MENSAEVPMMMRAVLGWLPWGQMPPRTLVSRLPTANEGFGQIQPEGARSAEGGDG